MHNYSKRLIALARTSGALANVAFTATAVERTPEQATAFSKFLEACAAAKPPVDAAACYAAAATADAVKRASKPSDKPADAPKPEPEAAKPEQPSKPHAGDKRTDYDIRVALVGELRILATGIYNGPSLAVRSNPKRIADAVYSDLFAAPKHRTTLAKLSVRDESALFLILKRGERNGAFDPVHLNIDAGIFSRLASVGFIERDGAIYKLSADALTHARKAAQRAA